jgi:hypothetical protein
MNEATRRVLALMMVGSVVGLGLWRMYTGYKHGYIATTYFGTHYRKNNPVWFWATMVSFAVLTLAIAVSFIWLVIVS